MQSKHNLVVQKNISNKTETRKIRIKTRPAHWRSTLEPIIVPLSIHSVIYEGFDGKFKLSAFLSSLSITPNRKITILICEGAHINCLNLRYNDFNITSNFAFHDAHTFFDNFEQEFHGYKVLFWKDFIVNNIGYKSARDKIYNLYSVDNEFRKIINDDAIKLLRNHLPLPDDKEKYLRSSELDLLEQCVYMLIVSDMGYKFEFYPGRRLPCLDYINRNVLDDKNKIIRVNVTIGTPKTVSS